MPFWALETGSLYFAGTNASPRLWPIRHPGYMEDDSSLLREASAVTDWWDMAVIGGHGDDDNHLAAGYRLLANAGVRQWQEAPRRNKAQDWIVVPIVNAYRHSIELALKAGIRDAAACVRMDGGVIEPDASPDVVERRLSRTHSLKDLTGELRRWLGHLRLDQAESISDALDALHDLDATGQTFRYSAVKDGTGASLKFVPARPEELAIDFVATAATLDHMAALLIEGLSLMLDNYAASRREVRADL